MSRLQALKGVTIRSSHGVFCDMAVSARIGTIVAAADCPQRL